MSTKMELTVNEGKTSRGVEDIVKEFIYLGSAIIVKVWRSNAGSLVPNGDTMALIGNSEAETSLVR